MRWLQKFGLLLLAFILPLLLREVFARLLPEAYPLEHYSLWIGLLASSLGLSCLLLAIWNEERGYMAFWVALWLLCQFPLLFFDVLPSRFN